MTFIQNKMTCLSPRTILFQRTTRSNLKFQCKIHEGTRGPEAGGGGGGGGVECFYDTSFRAQQPKQKYNIILSSWKCSQEVKNRHKNEKYLFFTS